MPERRCSTCRHWLPEGSRENVEAEERRAQARYGPNVGIGGWCGPPTRRDLRWGVASTATCEL